MNNQTISKLTVLLVALFMLSISATTNAGKKTITLYHTDALGSIVAASDVEGNVIWRKTYDPYGNEVITTENGEEYEGQAYTGKPYDKETGLLYLGQRYYDPEIKRFLSMDPVGFTASNPASFNRYAYANNNPYRFVDPDGRMGVDFRERQRVNRYLKGNITANQYRGELYSEGIGGLLGMGIAAGTVLGPQALMWGAANPHTVTQGSIIGADIAFGGVLAGGALRSSATKGVKALPAPRQIEAAWSASRYRHGGLMTAMEHINYRHAFHSGFSNVSKFGKGTSVKDIRSYVDSALRYGNVTKNGKNGFTVEYNLGRTIGSNFSGNAASNIKVHIRDGNIQTAFPF